MTTKTSPLQKRPAAKPSARPYHKGNVAQDLLEVARRLLKTERVEDITVRRLCREVGVTPGNFYNHFPTLEWLLLDLAADGFEAQQRLATRQMKGGRNQEDAIVDITVAMVEFGHANPELFRLMFGQISNEIVRGHERFTTAARNGFGKLVEALYGEDLFRPDDVAWSHANCTKAYALFAFAYGLARVISMEQITFPSGKKSERIEFVESLARIFVRGVGRA